MAEILFQISNSEEVRVSANNGDNLLDIARSANIAIDAPCSGNGACGKCRVKLISGQLDSMKSPHITEADYEDGWRLACASRVTGKEEIVIQVPDIASAYQSRIRTADLSDERELRIFESMRAGMESVGLGAGHPFIRVSVQMSEPTADDTLPDNERLENALKQETGCEKVRLGFEVVRTLAEKLRRSDFAVTALGEKKDGEFLVYDVIPAGEPSVITGLAIDIGTTTVSGVLTDLDTGEILSKASAGNGQIRYGADVINRIVEQSKPSGREKLMNAIVKETLIPLVNLLLYSAGLDGGQVVRVTIAGNSTMNHLLIGANANSLRMDPYIPTFFRTDPFNAAEIGLPVNPMAQVILAPNIGSYVGGDITAGTMASMIWNKEEFSLFIDLGTNGEIVFGNSDFLMSCACSAGPAFEGGDISCGMRATDGAIEAVKIDKDSMEPTISVVGDPGQKPVGICGSGIIDVIAELFRCGIIGANGQFIREGRRIGVGPHGMHRYILAFADESETGREISINRVDIESFVRAKGAIYSAIDTMLTSLDMTPDVIEHIYIAGGIGSGINIENAVRIGMLPDVAREKFSYIGNSSLAGAYSMVISDAACEQVLAVAANMTYLELSTYPGYMDHFVAACFLPHTDSSLFPSVTVTGL